MQSDCLQFSYGIKEVLQNQNIRQLVPTFLASKLSLEKMLIFTIFYRSNLTIYSIDN